MERGLRPDPFYVGSFDSDSYCEECCEIKKNEHEKEIAARPKFNTCGRCDGTGKYKGYKCMHCNGSGKISTIF